MGIFLLRGLVTSEAHRNLRTLLGTQRALYTLDTDIVKRRGHRGMRNFRLSNSASVQTEGTGAYSSTGRRPRGHAL